MATFKDRLSILLSVLAFTISAVSFYLTTLREVEPEIQAGSRLYISHDVYGKASVAMSVNITNIGARLFVIERLALLIHRPDSLDGYVMTPAGYVKVNDKGEPQDEGMVGPITVAGRGQVTKQILFKSSSEEDGFAITSPGKYECALIAWFSGEQTPAISDQFEIQLSTTDANQLSHWADLQVTNSVVVERVGGNEWKSGRVKDVQMLLKKARR
jgi:hypothetical protein